MSKPSITMRKPYDDLPASGQTNWYVAGSQCLLRLAAPPPHLPRSRRYGAGRHRINYARRLGLSGSYNHLHPMNGENGMPTNFENMIIKRMMKTATKAPSAKAVHRHARGLPSMGSGQAVAAVVLNLGLDTRPLSRKATQEDDCTSCTAPRIVKSRAKNRAAVRTVGWNERDIWIKEWNERHLVMIYARRYRST